MADPLKGSKGVYELAEHLITEIKQEMKSRRLNQFILDPLQPDELPDEVSNTHQLILIPEYFQKNENGFRMPRIMKRVKTESDLAYETRIKNYMLNMDD